MPVMVGSSQTQTGYLAKERLAHKRLLIQSNREVGDVPTRSTAVLRGHGLHQENPCKLSTVIEQSAARNLDATSRPVTLFIIQPLSLGNHTIHSSSFTLRLELGPGRITKRKTRFGSISATPLNTTSLIDSCTAPGPLRHTF